MNDTTIVILTAMNLEYRAVRAQLSDITAHTHPMGTRFEVGHLDRCRVALALTGKGDQSAAVLTERTAAEFAPAAVIFVGVAGALQPHLGLGDVVAATHVYAYHGATSQDDSGTSRPRTWELSHRVHQIAAHLERTGDWARQLPGLALAPRSLRARSPPERSLITRQCPTRGSGCASTTATRSRSRWGSRRGAGRASERRPADNHGAGHQRLRRRKQIRCRRGPLAATSGSQCRRVRHHSRCGLRGGTQAQ